VSSIKEMVDFTVVVLSRNVVVWTTQKWNGLLKKVTVEWVTEVNGGNSTRSIICHQKTVGLTILNWYHERSDT